MRAMKTQRFNLQEWRLLLAIPFVFASIACAQDTSTSTLKPNPTAALRAFEAPADQPYQLGRGDEISVEAIGRPELTGKHVIGPDGKITMPIAGSVAVADLTRDQAAGAIEHALDPYYNNATISVGVDKYTSNEITVLGAASKPGIMNFDKTPTLLEAVSRASSSEGGGGMSTGANSPAGSRPSNVPEEVTIYRGNETMVTVKLRELVDNGDPLANMRLKRDDIVYVSGKTSYVSVLGQVNHPGNLRLEKTSTLGDLLAQSGGITEKGGRNPAIQIIHQNGQYGPTTTHTVYFKSLLDHKSFDYSLQSGDIIYIPESGFNNASYTFQQLSPLVNLFTVASLLGGNGTF
jgi:polysaccharide biosynthesis/export protein